MNGNSEYFKTNVSYVAGVKIHSIGSGKVISLLQERKNVRENQNGLSIRFVNAFSISDSYTFEGYKNLLNSDGLNLVDGLPLAIALMLIRKEKFTRVRGPSFFKNVLAHDFGPDSKHLLVGSDPKTLGVLEEKISNMYPIANIVGSYSPPIFHESDENEISHIVQMVKSVDADFVWIALGTPKQDYVTAQIASKTKSTALGVGAAFDFLSGSKLEAPKIIQVVGLEWFFRLLTEPTRLWKRYLKGNLIFLYAVLKFEILKVSK